MVLRELLATFGVNVDDSQVKKATHSIDEMLGKVQTLVAGAMAVQVGKFFLQWVDGARQAADELNDMRNRLGVSGQALQEWGYSMKLAGLEAGSANMAFTMLKKAQGDAATGSKTQAAMFAQLGISIGDLNKLKPDELMFRVTDGIGKLSKETDKTNVAFGLFGRAGKEILPLLNQGSDAIREQAAEFRDLGAEMSEGFIDTAADASDEVDKLDFAFLGLRNTIAVQVGPWLNWLVLKAISMIKSFQKLAANTAIVKAGMFVLAAAVLKVLWVFKSSLIALAGYAAGIAIIVLLVDDLITLFSGGKSVIGDFIDTLFGVGTAAEAVHYLTDAWEGLILVVKDAYDAVREFIGLEVDKDRAKNRWDRKSAQTKEMILGQSENDTFRDSRIRANPTPLDERRGMRSGLLSPMLQGAGKEDLRTRVGTRTPMAPRTSQTTSNQTTIAPSTNVTINAGHASASEVASKVRAIVKDENAKALANTYNALVPSK